MHERMNEAIVHKERGVADTRVVNRTLRVSVGGSETISMCLMMCMAHPIVLNLLGHRKEGDRKPPAAHGSVALGGGGRGKIFRDS